MLVCMQEKGNVKTYHWNAKRNGSKIVIMSALMRVDIGGRKVVMAHRGHRRQQKM